MEGLTKPQKFTEHNWVIEIESEFQKEERSDESHDDLIYTVPKSLISEKTKVFYLPQVISLGPYHFEIKDPRRNDMERLKSEVARKMHRKISIEGGLKSVMEKFKVKEMQDKIKERYANNFELSSEACAWMIVRDACFVLEVLHRFGKDEDQEQSVKGSIDCTLSRKRHHPLLTEIVKDMLKMENQLPFWVLKEIRHHIVQTNGNDCSEPASKDYVWVESALKNLSPIEVTKGRDRIYKGDSHILQLLHDYIIDKPLTPSRNKQPGRPWMTITEFLKIVRKVIIYMLLSPICLCSPEKCVKWLFTLLYAIVLLFLFPVFVMFFIWHCIRIYISPSEKEIGKHVPTVEELKRMGVRFKKLEGDKLGISHIKFEKSDSILYLPKFKVDKRSEVILRNLVALEICSQDEEKPITRYAILMNDLINTSGDVGILRREEIITSKLGSDDEIAQLWNSMITSTEMPRYDPIDQVAESINAYRKKWWKVLWAQFIMVHCSKPWLFLSLVGGLILLGLTGVQVFCLFESCQLK